MNKIADRLRRHGLRHTAALALRLGADKLESLGPDGTLPTAWSDYLSWLSFAVPGMLHRGNVDAMSFAIQHLPSEAPMLEIGSFSGLSTCVLAYLRLKHAVSNRLFTCDRWNFEGQGLGTKLGDHPLVTHDQYRAFVRASFLRNAGEFCQPDLPHTVECYSDEFFARWTAAEKVTDVFGRDVTLGGSLSFCYIDGNHAYDFAKRDFTNADRHLVPGGFILFDDSADGSEWEVCQVVKEVLGSGSYHLVSKNPNYLVQKKA